MNDKAINDEINESLSFSDDIKNISLDQEKYEGQEEDLYDEPENYCNYDQKENKTKISSEKISPKFFQNNNNLNNQIESTEQFSENLSLKKIESKDENLNINSIADNKQNEKNNNNNFNSSKEKLENVISGESSIINTETNKQSIDFEKNYSFTYTESESYLNISKKEEDIDIDINKDLLTSFQNAFPYLYFPKDFKIIYKYLKDNKCFELTIFEIMNIIQREASIKLTEHRYLNKEQKNEYDNYSFFDPCELLDVFDPVYSNSEHLKIIKLFKTRNLKEKNRFFETKELTEDFFYTNNNEKRRKIIKFLNGAYNYIPKKCKNFEKCDKNDCIYAHNNYEINYHPLYYKTKYYDDQEYFESNKALCPTAKNFNEDFRIIYNYKDKKIINFLNKLNDTLKLKHITNKRIKLSIGKIKEFDLNTFKIFKCSNKKCEKDSHLCYKYHEDHEKRRPPYLYRYINEKCEEMEEEKKCKNKDFCNKCHTRNELNYHKLNFRKKVLCIRKIKNGKCIFIDTCYGYHDEKNEITIKNKIIDELDTKLEKLKKEKNVDVFKCHECTKIRKTVIFYCLKCKHILCKKCYNNIESKEICPICKKSFESDKVVKIDFKESSKKIDELISNMNQ